MYFQFTAEQRDFETHFTDQSLSSVMAVRMWSYITLTVPLKTCFHIPLVCSYFCGLASNFLCFETVVSSAANFIATVVLVPSCFERDYALVHRILSMKKCLCSRVE